MRKIVILKDSRGHKQGDIITVNPNEAHSLIDKGLAKLYHGEKIYEDKMLRPRRKYGSR